MTARCCALILASTLTLVCAAAAPEEPASAPEPGASTPEITLRKSDFRAAAAASAPAPRWISVPAIAGRITSRELGLVINTADPYSVEVGAFYIKARKLAPAQVLRVQLPVQAGLTPEEFAAFAAQVGSFFGAGIQALALAWTEPFAVQCNSITGALALGFDAGLCARSCGPSRRSPYFDSASTRPFSDLRLRPSMLLAAPDAAEAKAMIRRGVASDRSLGLRGAPPVKAHFTLSSFSTRTRPVR